MSCQGVLKKKLYYYILFYKLFHLCLTIKLTIITLLRFPFEKTAFQVVYFLEAKRNHYLSGI